MKTACHIAIFLLLCSPVFAQQFYARGEVKDESGNILQNVTILQHKTGYVFRSGTSGTFGIVSNQQIDTFSFSLDGYQKERIEVDAEKYLSVKMKRLSGSAANSRKDKLSSQTKDLEKEEQTDLQLHPFCFMEANSFFEQKFSAQQALEEMRQYRVIIKSVNGTMITIWHNTFLGTGKLFDGWREIYAQFIDEL